MGVKVINVQKNPY